MVWINGRDGVVKKVEENGSTRVRQTWTFVSFANEREFEVSYAGELRLVAHFSLTTGMCTRELLYSLFPTLPSTWTLSQDLSVNHV